MTDREVVRAYTSTLPPNEAAAFLAGLHLGLDHGEHAVAETVRRLLPRRVAALAVGVVRPHPEGKP